MPIELKIAKTVTIDAQAGGVPQPITRTQEDATIRLYVENRTYTLRRDDVRQALRELARDVTIGTPPTP